MGKIKTNENTILDYYIDDNPNELGYSISTCPITEEINSNLKKIEKIDNLVLTQNETKDLFFCNIGMEDLIGKYYDKNGFIYYELNNQVFRFKLKIKYLKNMYKNINNGV